MEVAVVSSASTEMLAATPQQATGATALESKPIAAAAPKPAVPTNPPLPPGPPPANAFANLKAAAKAKPLVLTQAGGGGGLAPIAAGAAKKAAAAHNAATAKAAAAKKPKAKAKAKPKAKKGAGNGSSSNARGLLGMLGMKSKAKAKQQQNLTPAAAEAAAPMDESNTDDDDAAAAAAEVFEHQYSEELLGDADDRAYIDGLDEDERELVMSERFEEREEAKDAWKQALQQKQTKAAAAAKKRKASGDKKVAAKVKAGGMDACVLIAAEATAAAAPTRPPRLVPGIAAPTGATGAADHNKRRRTDQPPVAAAKSKRAAASSSSATVASSTKAAGKKQQKQQQSAAGMMFFMTTKDKQAQAKKKKAAAKVDADATAATAAAAAAANAAAAAAEPPKKKKKPLLFMTPAERAEEKARVQMERAQAKLKERLEENGAWNETLKTTLGDRAAPVLEVMRSSSSSASSKKLIEGPPAPYPKDFEQHVRQLGSSASSPGGTVAAAAAASVTATGGTAAVVKMRAARPARASIASSTEAKVRYMNLELTPPSSNSVPIPNPNPNPKPKSTSTPPTTTTTTLKEQRPALDEAALSDSERLLYKRHYERCMKTPVGAEGASSLWSDRYRPQRADDVVGNAAAVSSLRTWMEAWKQRTARSEKKAKGSSSRKRSKSSASRTSSSGGFGRPAAMVLSSDDDFVVPDGYGYSDDSDDDGNGGLSNTKLLTGAAGVGKTASVYACAAELGYKVLEVHAGEKRSGSNLLAMLQEATQSHQVGSSTHAAADEAKAAAEAEAAAVEATSLRKGARVMVKWEGGTQHTAVIRKCYKNGSFDVDFEEDGTIGSNLTREEHGLALLTKSTEPEEPEEPPSASAGGGKGPGKGKGKGKGVVKGGKGKRKAATESPEPAAKAAGAPKKGFIYTTAGPAETPRTIAKELGIPAASLVKANAARYLGIKATSKLQKGTTLIYHGEDIKSSRKSPRSSSASSAAAAAASTVPVPETPDSSNGGVKLVEATVVLIEDIDTIFEEDRGFWAALESLIKSSKKPIVLTSTSQTPEIPIKSAVERLSFKRPAVDALLAHLRLLCKCEGIETSDSELRHIIRFFRRDVRKIFNSLEVWGKNPIAATTTTNISSGDGAASSAAAGAGGKAARKDSGMLFERILGLGTFCVGEPALAKDVLAAATAAASVRPAGLEAVADLLSYAESRDVDLLSATFNHLVVGRSSTESAAAAAADGAGAGAGASSDPPATTADGKSLAKAALSKVENMASIVDDLAELDAAAELLGIRSSGDAYPDPTPSVGSSTCRRAMMECNYFAQLLAVGPGRHVQTERLKAAISEDNLVHYNKQCIRLSSSPDGVSLRTAVLGGGGGSGGAGAAGERRASASSALSSSSSTNTTPAICTSNATTLLKTLKKAVAPSAKLRRSALGQDYLPFVRRIGCTESAREAAKVSRRFTHYLCSRGWSKRQVTVLADSLWEADRESQSSLLRFDGK
eukprot:gene11316-17934_t